MIANFLEYFSLTLCNLDQMEPKCTRERTWHGIHGRWAAVRPSGDPMHTSITPSDGCQARNLLLPSFQPSTPVLVHGKGHVELVFCFIACSWLNIWLECSHHSLGQQFATVEAITIMSLLFRSFTFELVDPHTEPAYSAGLTLPMAKGLPVRVKRRVY